MTSDMPTPPMLPAPLALPEPVDPQWVIEEPGFDVRRNRHVEAVMALGTGFMSVRSSLEERLADDDQSVEYERRMENVTLERIPARKSTWGTYIPALQADHRTLGRGLVNLPHCLGLEISSDGTVLDAESERVREQRRLLDLASATYYRSVLWSPRPGFDLSVRFRRFMPESTRFAIVQECSITAASGEADIQVLGFLDTDVRTNGFDMFVNRELGSTGGGMTAQLTTNRGNRVAVAALLTCGSGRCIPISVSGRAIGRMLRVRLTEGETLLVRKVVFVAADLYFGREVLPAALAGVEAISEQDADAFHVAHAKAWLAKWADCDVEVESVSAEQEKNQRAIRAAVYHLLRSKAPGDDLASVDAKGVTGDAYFGSVFWDADIFALPFYIYCAPDRARAHVAFRRRNLEAARRLAAGLGYPGARYPWQSAADGTETCIPWQYADHEVHVTADVAIGAWHCAAAAADLELLGGQVIDVLVETSRYWVGRVERARDGAGYRILGVMGPDEYKPLVNDNAYTNFCVRSALLCTLEAVALLKQVPGAFEPAAARLGITDEELGSFGKVAAGLRIPRDEARGIVWQCEGFATEYGDPDFDALWKDKGELFGRLVPQERRLRMKCLKQGDVVALFSLFPAAFDQRTICASFDYYLPFTVHDSSLSWCQHAIVAARLGKDALAYDCWRRSREIDFGDADTAADGIHIANAGGLWQELVLGFAGMDTALERNEPAFHPHLPHDIVSLRFKVHWKGAVIRVRITRQGAALSHDRPSAGP